MESITKTFLTKPVAGFHVTSHADAARQDPAVTTAVPRSATVGRSWTF
jgi:hypothetical protein